MKIIQTEFLHRAIGIGVFSAAVALSIWFYANTSSSPKKRKKADAKQGQVKSAPVKEQFEPAQQVKPVGVQPAEQVQFDEVKPLKLIKPVGSKPVEQALTKPVEAKSAKQDKLGQTESAKQDKPGQTESAKQDKPGQTESAKQDKPGQTQPVKQVNPVEAKQDKRVETEPEKQAEQIEAKPVEQVKPIESEPVKHIKPPIIQNTMEIMVPEIDTQSSICKDVFIEEDLSPMDEHAIHSVSWTDMVDEEAEEQERLQQELLSNQLTKSQPQIVPPDIRKSMSSDSGVASPTETKSDQLLTSSDKREPVIESGTIPKTNKKTSKYSKHQSCNSSDSGQGSEAGELMRFSYHFKLPGELIGKLIGHNGTGISSIRNQSYCDISVLRPHEYEAAINAIYCYDIARYSRIYIRENLLGEQEEPPRVAFEEQVIVIEGTRHAIDRCLEILRERFPLTDFPQLNFEQINKPKPGPYANTPEVSIYEGQYNQQLMIAQNIIYDVSVSAVVSAGHIFVQQTGHPSFLALHRLDRCINKLYSKNRVPVLTREEITPFLVCVACSENKWYRVQVVSYEPLSDYCNVKFVDFGGYSSVPITDLRKIRSDFMDLPFQAIECYLANVIPNNSIEWPLEAGIILQELLAQENQIVTCRMLGIAEDQIPMIHLYATNLEGHTRLLNRELVERNGAAWIEFAETFFMGCCEPQQAFYQLM